MRTVPLFEITYTEAPQVDRQAGVIRGVRILGRSSRNGRDYSDAALQQAARLYEGLGVNLNHSARAQRSGERAVEEGLGWLQDIEVKDDGVYGNLHYFRAHPQAGLLVEAAERNPRRFGLSHHAEGRVERRDGRLVVESIAAVKSVDVVQNPATNRGLFEASEAQRDATIGDVLHATRGPLADLVEDDLLSAAADVPLPADAGAGDDERVAFAVKSLAVNLLENEHLELIDRLRRAQRVLNAHHEFGCGTATAGLEAFGSRPATGPQPSAAAAGPDSQQLLERIERIEAAARCRLLLETENRDCTADRLDALAALPDDERRELIATWPARETAAAGRYRPRVSRPLVESSAEVLRFPESTRAFVAALR